MFLLKIILGNFFFHSCMSHIVCTHTKNHVLFVQTSTKNLLNIIYYMFELRDLRHQFYFNFYSVLVFQCNNNNIAD